MQKLWLEVIICVEIRITGIINHYEALPDYLFLKLLSLLNAWSQTIFLLVKITFISKIHNEDFYNMPGILWEARNYKNRWIIPCPHMAFILVREIDLKGYVQYKWNKLCIINLDWVLWEFRNRKVNQTGRRWREKLPGGQHGYELVKWGMGWVGQRENMNKVLEEWNRAASGKTASVCYGRSVQTKEWGEVWEKTKEKHGRQFITEDLDFEGEQIGIILNNMAEIV